MLGSDAVIRLKEAPAVMRYRNIPYLGSFRCSDPRLNDIWMTGAYTVHLNMQEYLWDGIKRDRVVWLGDMHPEVSTIMAVFGYNEVVDKSIDLACEQFPLPQWLNGMSAYSMWYLIIQYEWYMHNGNLDYLRKHRDYITGLIDCIDSCVDEEGNESLAKSRFWTGRLHPMKQEWKLDIAPCFVGRWMTVRNCVTCLAKKDMRQNAMRLPDGLKNRLSSPTV